MASITASANTLANSCLLFTWTPFTEADTCVGVQIPWMADKSVHVKGTFGTATVKIQGSNDGATAAVFSAVTLGLLNKPDGTQLSFATEGLNQILENPVWIRPIMVAGGTGMSTTILLVCKPMTRTL